MNQIPPWNEAIRKVYASAIGKHKNEIVTPALLLDLDRVRGNISFMMESLKNSPVKLRPHIKGQKSIELARLQVAAGAIGVCTATVWEAIVMGRAGIPDVLIANQVGGQDKIRALAEAASSGRYTVAVDHAGNAEELSKAACAAGSVLEVLIELDVGQGRGGVRSVAAAQELAVRIAEMKHLHFRGMMGYEGHCMLEPDRKVRIEKAKAAMDLLWEAVQKLQAAGFPSDVVSAGGTGTYDITGADPRVTELQAGSYVFMDGFHGALVPGFSRALTVLGTISIVHGDTIVLDSGRKSVGIDFVQPVLLDYPEYQARYFAEEHALFDVDERCKLKHGDTAELVPGYAPTTVNLHDVYHVVENGIVTDIWPIIPRGPSHQGLI